METQEMEEVDWNLLMVSNELDKGKKRVIAGIIMFVAGILLALVMPHIRTEKLIELNQATKEGQYVYTSVRYMTIPFAYYDTVEDMQFYFASDIRGNQSILCVHNDELSELQPYIDEWMYGVSVTEALQEKRIVGFAYALDDDLRQIISESYQDYFGYALEDGISEKFGNYYIQVGAKGNTHYFVQIGAFIAAIGIGLFMFGLNGLYNANDIMNRSLYPDDGTTKKGNILLGILGAVIGAVLGSILWVFLGICGFLNLWVSVPIMFFAFLGYSVLYPKNNIGKLIICALCGVLGMGLGIWMEWSWNYYAAINEGISGYVSFAACMSELSMYLTEHDSEVQSAFMADAIFGGFFAIIGIIIIVKLYKDELEKEENKNVGN